MLQLFSRKNELDALALVRETKALPSTVFTQVFAGGGRQEKCPKPIVDQSIPYNSPVIVDVKCPA